MWTPEWGTFMLSVCFLLEGISVSLLLVSVKRDFPLSSTTSPILPLLLSAWWQGWVQVVLQVYPKRVKGHAEWRTASYFFPNSSISSHLSRDRVSKEVKGGSITNSTCPNRTCLSPPIFALLMDKTEVKNKNITSHPIAPPPYPSHTLPGAPPTTSKVTLLFFVSLP